MKQTAVEYLANVWAVQGTLYTQDINQAKEMEKEQIRVAYMEEAFKKFIEN